MRSVPTVKALLSPSGRTVRVLCPFCGNVHGHGTGGIDLSEPTSAHRVPGCGAVGGYVLELTRKAREAFPDGIPPVSRVRSLAGEHYDHPCIMEAPVSVRRACGAGGPGTPIRLPPRNIPQEGNRVPGRPGGSTYREGRRGPGGCLSTLPVASRANSSVTKGRDASNNEGNRHDHP